LRKEPGATGIHLCSSPVPVADPQGSGALSAALPGGRQLPVTKSHNSNLLPALTVIDLHIETVRVQLPVNHVATALESALSGFNSTINAFRTFDCDYFLYALELVTVRTANVLEKSYEI
jgi:hypothetical protein